MLIAFHKPYGVLSRFTPDGSAHTPLEQFGFPPGVYPLGRLDADSEGLLLLSDEPELNARLLHPRHQHERAYRVQVERVPDAAALDRLRAGVEIGGGHRTLPCRVRRIEWEIPPRQPPIRFRKNVPDCWLELALTEGRNRQVRRMTAAVGHPTLRLIRVRIGRFSLDPLQWEPGRWRELAPGERTLIFSSRPGEGPAFPSAR